MRFKKEEINKEELNDVISFSKKILKLLYIFFIAALILAIIILIKTLNIHNVLLDFLSVISPFFIGFIVSWLLRPLVLLLNKKVKNNTISSILVFMAFVLILFLCLYIFIPTIYEEVNELVGLLPSFVEKLTKSINDLFSRLSASGLNLDNMRTDILANISKSSTSIATNLPQNIINFIISLFSGLGTIAMGLVIGIYMLIDYENISKFFKKLFPRKWQEDVHNLSSEMSSEARKSVNGTFLVALMVLICDSIGFALVGLNAPILFGFFCGLTDLIPFIGPYIGGATAVIVGFTQSPLIGIGTLIIAVLVQLIENYVLQPIVMGKASSLHPVIIIIGLLVFGHFFGIIGMVLATPILTILRVVIEFTKEKIKLRKNV